MSVMPKWNKACSVACTALFGMGLLMLPSATARVVEDSASETRATVLPQTGEMADSGFSDAVSVEAVGQWENPGDRLQPMMMSGGNIQLNTPCVGITPAKAYFGVWKPLGSNKAKCKEGAGGQPGAHITRLTCRIVTINDGNFDNAVITGPETCLK